MKKLYYFLFVILVFTSRSYATHIVGGELFLRYKSFNQYQLGLNMYFDNINGNPSILTTETVVEVNIYRKSDDVLMGIYDIPLVVNNLIAYTNPLCSSGTNVQTRILVYSTDISLSSSLYNDPQGYYIVWERCCRNGTISNLVNPGTQGNTFYLSFPSLVNGGQDIIDNSPQFPVITGDYACINQPFVFDFSATDPDGDELKYSLVTPYRGHGTQNNPGGVQTDGNGGLVLINVNEPEPYPSVDWASGYGLSNIIPGNQPVGVNSKTGIISFTANQLGLYVFSVLCEEYRNGIKIGEVRRDFQIKVIDCQKNVAPDVKVKNNKGLKQIISDGSVIRVGKNDSRCYPVLLNDKLSGTSVASSTLNLKVMALNFPQNLVSITPSSGTVVSDFDTLKAQLCLDNCAVNQNGQPLQVAIVVSDNGCPTGLTDTIRVFFDLDPKGEIPPQIFTDLPNNEIATFVFDTIRFNVIATEADSGIVTINAKGRGFKLEDVGMSFENGKTGLAKVIDPFVWPIDCSVFGKVADNKFIIDFITDNQQCKNRYDTVTVTITIQDSIVNYNFLPVNVFTPNDDKYNRYFEMSNIADSVRNLPRDNCLERFNKIEIYNRWGKMVYESHNRNFQWEANGFPVGNYYYLVYYTNRKYKGSVSIVK